MRHVPKTLLVLAAGLLALSACGGRPVPPPNVPSAPASRPSGPPAFSHAFVIVMENHGYAAALAQPSTATLAAQYAVATDYHAVAHPSLPNYLALTSGETWVASDCTGCYVTAPNLASEATAAGVTWGAYMEGLPGDCWLGAYWPPGRYAAKHDPFRYYTNVRNSPSLCERIRPLTALDAGLSAGKGPRLVWITPDLCHDGHDCSAAVADQWLGGFVRRITASRSWTDGGALFITWDEAAGRDDTGGGGHVLTLVIAPGVPAGRKVALPYNHYSLLATVEAGLDLPRLGHAADASTTTLAAFWNAPLNAPPG